MPSTLLVTGASGFIGFHLAQALVDGGRRVRAITRKPHGYDKCRDPAVGDMADLDSLRKAMAGIDVAYYILGDAGVPVTVLRAAILIGHGNVSWRSPASRSTYSPAW